MRGKVFKVISLVTVLVMLLSITSIPVLAAGDTASAELQLYDAVYAHTTVKREYKLSGGGKLAGTELWESNTSGNVKAEKYALLTTGAQQDFVNDIIAATNKAISDEKIVVDSTTYHTNNVTNETATEWFRRLQTTEGIGPKLLTGFLSDTKPDFITANKIYSPFSSIVGTILGILAILGMSLLGVVLVSDVMYIALPPLQALVPPDGPREARAEGTSAVAKLSFIFSDDARYAVRTAMAEENGKKQAYGIYLKRRVVMLILLGICLLYLVSGQIYSLVGKLLDLVSGFLGF